MSEKQTSELALLYQESAKTATRKDITIRFKLKFGKKFKHVTITYLGDVESDNVFAATKEFMDFFADYGQINFIVRGHDMFGPPTNKTIRVLLLDFEDQAIKAKVVAFHEERGVAEPGFGVKFDEPNFHCSVNDEPELFDTAVGTVLEAENVDAKIVGPVDPFYTVNF